jgi:gentisate 1,2-dioxygenase
MDNPLGNQSELARRRAYYERISAHNMAPLWEVLGSLVPVEPQSQALPAIWHFSDLREHILEAGQVISAKEAERRVLVLENPGLRGQSCITQSLYAGMQMLMPGEVAPAHRHTQSALRLVLEGEGAYTAVDGERTTMHRGDFIVTPAWTWHDHGNPGKDTVIWLDGLDIPIVRFLGAGFAEKSTQATQPQTRPEGDSLARFGSNLLPLDFAPQAAEPTRTFVYPYRRVREALTTIARSAPDAHHAFKQRYVNPATGASPMPTIGAFAQLLPADFATRPIRSTDGTIHVCIEGSGRVRVGANEWTYQPNDVFVVPPWEVLSLTSAQESVLISFSDRPVQLSLGLWREQRL